MVVVVLLFVACGDDSQRSASSPDSMVEPITEPVGPGTTTPIVPALPVPNPSVAQLLGVRAVEVATGFERPSFAIAPWGDDRLFVLEQGGIVSIITDGQVLEEPFLDLTGEVGSGGLEQGLLGLAFHPAFPDDDRFFVYFTDRNGNSNLASYRVSTDPNVADPSSAAPILFVEQPATNHNGGMIQFGLDGYLYLGLGDGGGANDTFGNGQRIDTLLGTVLRLDIDAAAPFRVPPSNPFVEADGADQVWLYGLRNPWRFDIDPVTGLMYIADVGQAEWEEISVVDPTGGGGNLGWPILEGVECLEAETCDGDDTVLPVVVYSHAEGCSVTGGFVYRGAAIPELTGHYFYSDWCTGFVRSFAFGDGGVSSESDWSTDVGDLGRISSFGRDGAGELYLVGTQGSIWRIEAVRAG